MKGRFVKRLVSPGDSTPAVPWTGYYLEGPDARRMVDALAYVETVVSSSGNISRREAERQYSSVVYAAKHPLLIAMWAPNEERNEFGVVSP